MRTIVCVAMVAPVPLLCAAILAVLLPTFQTVDSNVDLSSAVIRVVDGNESSSRMMLYARMLQEEVKRRTHLQWDILHTRPLVASSRPTILITNRSMAKDPCKHSGYPPAEGFTICVSTASAGLLSSPVVWIVGNDERGVLFGVGRLLRELRMSNYVAAKLQETRKGILEVREQFEKHCARISTLLSYQKKSSAVQATTALWVLAYVLPTISQSRRLDDGCHAVLLPLVKHLLTLHGSRIQFPSATPSADVGPTRSMERLPPMRNRMDPRAPDTAALDYLDELTTSHPTFGMALISARGEREQMCQQGEAVRGLEDTLGSELLEMDINHRIVEQRRSSKLFSICLELRRVHRLPERNQQTQWLQALEDRSDAFQRRWERCLKQRLLGNTSPWNPVAPHRESTEAAKMYYMLDSYEDNLRRRWVMKENPNGSSHWEHRWDAHLNSDQLNATQEELSGEKDCEKDGEKDGLDRGLAENGPIVTSGCEKAVATSLLATETPQNYGPRISLPTLNEMPPGISGGKSGPLPSEKSGLASLQQGGKGHTRSSSSIAELQARPGSPMLSRRLSSGALLDQIDGPRSSRTSSNADLQGLLPDFITHLISPRVPSKFGEETEDATEDVGDDGTEEFYEASTDVAQSPPLSPLLTPETTPLETQGGPKGAISASGTPPFPPPERLGQRAPQLALPPEDARGTDEWFVVPNRAPSFRSRRDQVQRRLGSQGSRPHTEKPLLSCRCELVRPMMSLSGVLQICRSRFFFFVDRATDEYAELEAEFGPQKDHGWPIQAVKAIHGRRYLLRDSAVEIFLDSRKSVFLHFSSSSPARAKETRKKVARLLSQHGKGQRSMQGRVVPVSLGHPANVVKRNDWTQRWQRGEMSNFEYLMKLNTAAGRTYHDLTQYPVFPWILSDYESPTLDLSNPAVYRDLSKPIGALNPERLEDFVERYESFSDPDIPKFHYGSHYSSVGSVLFYLLRLEPFASHFIALQSGRFDNPDRLFHSLPSAWANVLRSASDVKELIPEFFYLPEFLRNDNDLALGVKAANGERVDDVVLPPWAHSPEHFIETHRQALESAYVSAHLHEWIDLIFGFKQRGKPSIDAHNVFYYLTYDVDLDAIEDPIMRKAVEIQIANFGQTPRQLFQTPHPKRMSTAHKMSCPFPAQGAPPYKLEASPYLEPFLYQPVSPSPPALIAHLPEAEELYIVCENGRVCQYRYLQSTPNGQGLPFSIKALDGKTPFPGSRRLVRPPFALRGSSAWGGTAALVGCEHHDHTLVVMDQRQGFVQRVGWHKSRITCLTWEGDFLVSGSLDATLCVWEARVEKGGPVIISPPRHVLRGHDHGVVCVAANEGLGIIVSGSQAGTCVVHGLRSGRVLRSIGHPHESPILNIAICPANLRIFTQQELPPTQRRTIVVAPSEGSEAAKDTSDEMPARRRSATSRLRSVPSKEKMPDQRARIARQNASPESGLATDDGSGPRPRKALSPRVKARFVGAPNSSSALIEALGTYRGASLEPSVEPGEVRLTDGFDASSGHTEMGTKEGDGSSRKSLSVERKDSNSEKGEKSMRTKSKWKTSSSEKGENCMRTKSRSKRGSKKSRSGFGKSKSKVRSKGGKPKPPGRKRRASSVGEEGAPRGTRNTTVLSQFTVNGRFLHSEKAAVARQMQVTNDGRYVLAGGKVITVRRARDLQEQCALYYHVSEDTSSAISAFQYVERSKSAQLVAGVQTGRAGAYHTLMIYAQDPSEKLSPLSGVDK